ncbi:hypothetical protein [Salinispira pacifica]|uniref:Uncharacterized protein n=1 Tax=Salinispira pacifica TaxID=1307761 RepID=V5WLX1_9SPIO|nr:hypothetical protein [Salinispira pacifica]AHC16605.1 hypothetical protein L21SP2_3265 [Salinispira pacifica]
MKFVWRMAVTCLLIPVISLGAQDTSDEPSTVQLDTIDFETIDFSEARLSIAGPSAFLIRSVRIEGEPYSVLFKEQNGNWVVTELIAQQGEPVLPDNVVLDFARVTVEDSALVIDGILINGKPYSTRLELRDDALRLSGGLQAGKLVGSSLSRITLDAGLSDPETLDRQQEQLAELTERNTRLLAQVGSMNGSLEQLRTKNAEIQEQLEQLKKEKSDLLGEVDNLQARLTASEAAAEESARETAESAADESDPEDNAAAESGGTDSNVEEINQELIQRIGTLLQKIDSLEDHISGLETEISALRESVPEESAGEDRSERLAGQDVREYTQRIETLEDEIRDLKVENSRLAGERNELEQDIRRELLEKGVIEVMRPRLTRDVQEGFSIASTQIGSWEQSGSAIRQTDPGEFFAKLELPLAQDSRPTLYSFDARSRQAGWVGFGVHIFASGVEKRGYGYGESLLLWFTRDRDTYGNDQTYMELYRSSDDINMARVLSAAIPESLGEWLNIELLYQPDDEYITVAVNGEEKLRYKTWFGIESGVDMALRTLNAGEFRNLQVLSTED